VNIANISTDVSQAQASSSNVATPSPSARPVTLPGSTAAAGAAAASTTTGSHTSDPTSDQATISSASGVLSTALNGSDVRTAKVAALQASINAGTYNVPASSVADKMLNSILGS
jgi:negative regulator of flagellin synthesis FlgM